MPLARPALFRLPTSHPFEGRIQRWGCLLEFFNATMEPAHSAPTIASRASTLATSVCAKRAAINFKWASLGRKSWGQLAAFQAIVRSAINLASHWTNLVKLASFRKIATTDCSSFHSIKEIEHSLMSPHSSAALVPVQLAQCWQHASDGFSRPVRLL
jgi:hypothetical protein